MLKRTTLIALLLAAPLAAAWQSACAAPWPDRPVTLVVPSSPGGGTDAFARVLAQALGESLKQTVLVDNRPGASGNIGAEAVTRAAPDGYTFLVAATASVAISPALFAKLAFNVERDLVPVARGVSSPFVLLASPSLGVGTLAELVGKARREPGQIAFGSAGTGTVPYLGVRMLEEASGARFNHVPYKGLAPAFQDLIGGQIAFVFTDLASGAPHLQRLKPLAVTEPVALLPNVPTFAKAGFADMKADNYFNVLAPAATPPAIVERMNAAVNDAMRRPDVAAKLDRLGLLPVFETPQQFALTLKQERATWAAFIQRNGIRQSD